MNLIYQTYVREDGFEPNYVKYSREAFSSYADRHNAAYEFQSEKICSVPYYQKLETIWDPRFDQYDKVLYVDSDVLPVRDVNIFDQPCEYVAMVSAKLSTHHMESMFAKHNLQLTSDLVTWYNSGVMMMSREFRQIARKKFTSWESWYNTEGESGPQIWDETYINYNLMLSKIRVDVLLPRWNVWYQHRKNYPTVNFFHFSNEDKAVMGRYYRENML